MNAEEQDEWLEAHIMNVPELTLLWKEGAQLCGRKYPSYVQYKIPS